MADESLWEKITLALNNKRGLLNPDVRSNVVGAFTSPPSLTAPVQQAQPPQIQEMAGQPQQPSLSFNYPTMQDQPYQESPEITKMRLQDLAMRQGQGQQEYEQGLQGGGWGSTGLAMSGKEKMQKAGQQRTSLIEDIAEGEKRKAVNWASYVKEYKKTLTAELKSLYAEYERARQTPDSYDDETVLAKYENLINRANMDLGEKDAWGLSGTVKRLREGRKLEMATRKATEKKPIPVGQLANVLKLFLDKDGNIISGQEENFRTTLGKIMQSVSGGEVPVNETIPTADPLKAQLLQEGYSEEEINGIMPLLNE